MRRFVAPSPSLPLGSKSRSEFLDLPIEQQLLDQAWGDIYTSSGYREYQDGWGVRETSYTPLKLIVFLDPSRRWNWRAVYVYGCWERWRDRYHPERNYEYRAIKYLVAQAQIWLLLWNQTKTKVRELRELAPGEVFPQNFEIHWDGVGDPVVKEVFRESPA